MATKTRKSFSSKKFTAEQKAEYHAQQREEAGQRLEQAVSELQSSDGFARWLQLRSKFRNYSLNNTFLIQIQCPDATAVTSGKKWNELGRSIIKGETAIRIFAPMEWFVKCDESDQGARWNAKRERFERKIRTFKLVPVFDVSQTHGDELAEPPAPVEPNGDSHAHLEPALVTLASELGFEVRTETLPDDLGGYCDHANKVIAIASSASANARVRVLVHEIAHALGIGYAQFGRKLAEVLVESVTYIVLAGQGFELDASSVPYIAGWASGTDAAAKMREFAETIDTVARRIEGAL